MRALPQTLSFLLLLAVLSASQAQDAPPLIEEICQASLLRDDAAKCLLFSNPAFSNPTNQKNRINLTVRASTDDANTWRTVVVLHPGPSAYSCLVALGAATAGSLYENGEKRPYEKITFARFGLAP